jgi:very-short-patch-repair endonuclease
MKHTEETKKKISIAMTGRKLSAITKLKIGLKSKGRRHSELTKLKLSYISKNRIHKPCSEETKKKISIAQKGKPRKKCSEETKIKIGLKHKGKRLSAEIKQKISNSVKLAMTPEIIAKIKKALTGKKLSDETKLKISKKLTGRNVNGVFTIQHKKNISNARKLQVLPTRDTSIEIKIQQFCKELNIEFIAHKYIDIQHDYLCDIYIPSKNLIIECDGDYWHNYPIGLDIDHVRTNEIQKKGYLIIRLWECDIRKMTKNDFENILSGVMLKNKINMRS